MQAILKRVVKVARFYAEEDGFAMIEIRGGMSMQVPLGVEGDVTVCLTTNWLAYGTQQTEAGLIPLTPTRDGKALKAAPTNPDGSIKVIMLTLIREALKKFEGTPSLPELEIKLRFERE